MKILLLVFILLIGILGITTEKFSTNERYNTFFNWQCPNTIKKCPEGCIKQKTPDYKCGKKINYSGPNMCSRACNYICSDPKKCGTNECCETCGISDVQDKCLFETFISGDERSVPETTSTSKRYMPVFNSMKYSPLMRKEEEELALKWFEQKFRNSSVNSTSAPDWNTNWPLKSGAPNHLDKVLIDPTYFDAGDISPTEINPMYTFGGENHLSNYDTNEITPKEEHLMFQKPYMKDDNICKRLMF